MNDFSYWNWCIFDDIPYAKHVYYAKYNDQNYVACLHNNNVWEVFSDNGQVGLAYYNRIHALDACVRSSGESDSKTRHVWTIADSNDALMRAEAVNCLIKNNVLAW